MKNFVHLVGSYAYYGMMHGAYNVEHQVRFMTFFFPPLSIDLLLV